MLSTMSHPGAALGAMRSPPQTSESAGGMSGNEWRSHLVKAEIGRMPNEVEVPDDRVIGGATELVRSTPVEREIA
jgi:hypothetical protein